MIGWIKTADRLPDNANKCWVYSFVLHGNANETYIDARHYFNGWMGEQWYNTDDYHSLISPSEQVTHWMPYYTPEPPTD